MKRDSLIYCHQVLPEVSRTFALGIDLLRAPLRGFNLRRLSYLPHP